MRIYFAHPRSINYQEIIYQPVKGSRVLSTHDFILPHDDKTDKHHNNNRDFYRTIDLMIAEVSEPSTGLGIELGWTHDSWIPIYCFYRDNVKPSGSIWAVTKHIVPYRDPQDFIKKVETIIKHY